MMGPAVQAGPRALKSLAGQRNIVFNRLGTEDGLSQTTVTAITQDSDGFVWIGTSEGLNRFDGYTFKTFFHLDDNPGSISHDAIWDVLSDTDGKLWVATDSGLNRFNEVSDTFDVFYLGIDKKLGEPSNKIYTLFEDSKQRLWIGTGAGLALRTKNDLFTHYKIQNPEQKIGIVRSVFEDSKGNVWVGTEFDGLYRINDTSHQLEPVRGNMFRHTYVRDILEDNDGNIWVATSDKGILILDKASGDVHSLAFDSVNGQNLDVTGVRVMLKDNKGDIWVGTEIGLHLWVSKEEGFIRYTSDPTDIHSLSDNWVQEIFQDAGGVVWVGTLTGVSRWNTDIDAFPHFKRSVNQTNGLSSNSIASFAEAENGDVWIGTLDGLDKWSAIEGLFTHFGAKDIGLTDDKVMSLAVTENLLWVGTMTGGLNLIDGDRVVDTFQHDKNDATSISSNAVSSIMQDRFGNVWLTTYGGGVNKYLGEHKFERFPRLNNVEGQFSNLRAVDMIETAHGEMWIATDGGGVIVLDPITGNTSIHQYSENDSHSLSSNNVISLLEAGGSIWVGTRDGGLNRYDAELKHFERLSKAEGLTSDSVYGMLMNKDGYLWVSGGKGLSVYDMEANKFTHYDSTHGLQNDDFNSGASLELSDGSFLFGGHNGFNAIYPDRVKSNSYIPPIKITQFSKFNKPYSLPIPVYKTDTIELDSKDSVIGFKFVAMDYTAPHKNKFRFMLEGFDQDWVETDSTQMTYTNLDAGRYVFKVLGSNNDGLWNEKGASINLIVNPPLWATWWAYLFYLLVGIAFLYRFQSANEDRLRRETEKRYSERLQLYIESLEEATDCVLIADANKHLMYANNATKIILNELPAEVVGNSIFSLLFADPLDASNAREGLGQDGRWHGEVQRNNGTEIATTEITISAVHDDNNNETAFVSIVRDVTHRKKTEAELEVHRHGLQNLVDERTKLLQHEIAENKAVQNELANSLKEKELLLKEVHHRVKNNMQVISSLLNIQAETVGNDVFSDLLGESQQRIKSMSLIHENLYQSDNLLEINFNDYINMLAHSLHRFYSVPGAVIILDIQVDNVRLDIETAVPCGLIINELISNSLKHAFKNKEGKGEGRGTITINFRNVGCRYVLEIKDDGKGLPEGFNLESASSMGMEIVTILTQQLDGRLRYESKGGTLFEISFPRKVKHDS